MPERTVLVLAVAAAVGAWGALSTPWWLGAVGVLIAFAFRRPSLLCVAIVLLAGSAAATARAGLSGLEPRVVDEEVTLLTDPERFGEEVRFEARLGRRHVEAWVADDEVPLALPRLAGERVVVRGRVEPFDGFDGRQLSRHLAGRLAVTEIVSWRPGSTVHRLANQYRSLLVVGAEHLDDDERSLLAGLVLGDDRGQSPVLVDAFRGAGLTHLLAVSGQNVAFVLVVVDPVLRRLPRRARASLAVVALAGFGVITRFEPSVLRAIAMATVAVVATARGQPASGRRALGLAVMGLVLIDPLLVHSIGFQLSVAASFGILTWSTAVAEVLPMPGWLARPVGVVVAAQVSVAPLLVVAFGPLPVASLPANVLAGPAAGPAMIWGMTGGVVAGAVPSLAPVLHLPTRVVLGWIEWVARLSSAAPLGGITVLPLLALVLGLGLVVRGTSPVRRAVGSATLGAAVTIPVATALLAPVPLRTAVGGATVWRAGGDVVLVIHDPPRPVDLLGALRRARVRGVDLVAVEGSVEPALVDALRQRFGPVMLLATAGPAPRQDLGPAGSVARVGALDVVVRVAGAEPVLDVVPAAVRSSGASGARAPPL